MKLRFVLVLFAASSFFTWGLLIMSVRLLSSGVFTLEWRHVPAEYAVTCSACSCEF